jgi:uncharacterized membrane protein (UPF0136 family)
MNKFRKLEVVCGAATAILGIAAAAQMLHTDMETMRRLGRSFPVFQELIVGAIIYALPGSLVAVGAYFHATNHRQWGLLMVIVSSLFLVVVFVLLVLAPAFYTPNLLLRLNLSLAAVAIVTTTVSIVAHFRNR